VVNYADDTMSKVATATMTVVQVIATGRRPVGVTYDPVDNRVWVANYSGSLGVYDDR
jgi:DNA-binding beta-propeller fold protein YncE